MEKEKEETLEELAGYSPNNLKENLIDSITALIITTSTISYAIYNYSHKIQDITNQAYQLANDLSQYIPFVNS